MAYDPQKDLNEIVYRKGRYTSGDDKTKKWAQESAGQYYKNLMDNGYEALADQYKNMDYMTAFDNYKTNYSPDKPQKSNTQDYIDKMRENADTMLDAEYQKQNEMFQRDMDKTNQRYNDAKKDSYFDYRTQNQHINQQLGANGITGGAAESTISSNANNYLNGLNALDKEKNSTISDIEAEKRAAYYDMISKKAQNEIDFAREGRAAFESDRNFNEGVRRSNIQDAQWQLGFDSDNEWRGKEFALKEDAQEYDQMDRDRYYSLSKEDQDFQHMDANRKFTAGEYWNAQNNDRANRESYRNMAIADAEMGNYAPLAELWGTTAEDVKNMYMTKQIDSNKVAGAMSAAELGYYEPLASILGVSATEMETKIKNMIAYENSFNQGRSGGSRGGRGYGGGYYGGDYITVDAPVSAPTYTPLDEGRGPIAPPVNTKIPPGQLTYNWNPWITGGTNPFDLNNAGKDLGFISE